MKFIHHIACNKRTIATYSLCHWTRPWLGFHPLQLRPLQLARTHLVTNFLNLWKVFHFEIILNGKYLKIPTLLSSRNAASPRISCRRCGSALFIQLPTFCSDTRIPSDSMNPQVWELVWKAIEAESRVEIVRKSHSIWLESVRDLHNWILSGNDGKVWCLLRERSGVRRNTASYPFLGWRRGCSREMSFWLRTEHCLVVWRKLISSGRVPTGLLFRWNLRMGMKGFSARFY